MSREPESPSRPEPDSGDPQPLLSLSTSASRAEMVRLGALALVGVAVVALVVTRFDDVVKGFGMVWGVAGPLLAGFVIAYLVNLVMSAWERLWFPHSESVMACRTRRPACLILALLTIAGVVAAIVAIVQGEIREAFGALGRGFVAAANSLADSGLDVAGLAAYLPQSMGDWEALAQQTMENLGGPSSVLSSVATAGGHVAHFALGTVVAIVFALYVLIDKERVASGGKTFAARVLPHHAYERVAHVATVANECFSRFITGQCIEACVLGCLCALGMFLFGFPYAATIGLLVGATALVPLIGAWIGGILGALMIFSVEPIQAVWFVVFLVVLQQIEGHVVYPNVVGTSVGVPGIWVLVAVFAGGSLLGIGGILLGVPVVATIRRLVMESKALAAPGDEAPRDDSGGPKDRAEAPSSSAKDAF